MKVVLWSQKAQKQNEDSASNINNKIKINWVGTIQFKIALTTFLHHYNFTLKGKNNKKHLRLICLLSWMTNCWLTQSAAELSMQKLQYRTSWKALSCTVLTEVTPRPTFWDPKQAPGRFSPFHSSNGVIVPSAFPSQRRGAGVYICPDKLLTAWLWRKTLINLPVAPVRSNSFIAVVSTLPACLSKFQSAPGLSTGRSSAHRAERWHHPVSVSWTRSCQSQRAHGSGQGGFAPLCGHNWDGELIKK